LFENVCTQEAGGNRKKDFQRILYVQLEAKSWLSPGRQRETVHAKHQPFGPFSVQLHRYARVEQQNDHGHRVVGGDVHISAHNITNIIPISNLIWIRKVKYII